MQRGTAIHESTQWIDGSEAEILLAYLLRQPRELIIAHNERRLSPLTRVQFFRLVRQRAKGMPIAYLTGHKEFFGLDFIVNKHVLIPRPETEMMVELALHTIKNQKSKVNCQLSIVDIGTGSGCIPIAIAKTIEQSNNRAITIFATDISRRALRVAKQNARRHGDDITFLHGNLLEPLIKKIKLKIRNLEFFITANLPYLTQEEFDVEPSIQYEPRQALVAHNAGVSLYEELLNQIKRCTVYASRCTIFLEINPSQSSTMTSLIAKYLPDTKIEIKKDLAGRDRVVMIKF